MIYRKSENNNYYSKCATLKARGCGALTVEETSHAGSAVPLDRHVRQLRHLQLN